MHLIFLLYALFGSIFTAAKIGLEHAEPFFMVGSRMLAAGVLLLAYLLLFKREVFVGLGKHAGKLVALGFFNIYLTNGLEFWGMKQLTSSKTSFIYSLSPFFAALLSFLILGERLSKKKWLGLVTGFIGFIPILWHDTAHEGGLAAWGFLSWAELAVMGAALATVYGWIVMRQLVTEGMEPILANAASMIAGGVMALLHSGLQETWQPVPVFGSWSVFCESTVWMIVVSSLICYNLYGYLLRRYTVTLMSFGGFTTPFFVAIFSWFVLGETLSWSFYLSAMIVLAGLSLFYWEELQKEGITKQEIAG